MLLFLYQTSEVNNNNNRHNSSNDDDDPQQTFHPNAVLNYLRFKGIVDNHSVVGETEEKMEIAESNAVQQ